MENKINVITIDFSQFFLVVVLHHLALEAPRRPISLMYPRWMEWNEGWRYSHLFHQSVVLAPNKTTLHFLRNRKLHRHYYYYYCFHYSHYYYYYYHYVSVVCLKSSSCRNIHHHYYYYHYHYCYCCCSTYSYHYPFFPILFPNLIFFYLFLLPSLHENQYTIKTAI